MENRMSQVGFEVECLICKMDAAVKENIDFEVAQSGSSELEIWKAVRPLLRAYATLVDMITDIQDNIMYERSLAKDREEALEDKLNKIIFLLSNEK